MNLADSAVPGAVAAATAEIATAIDAIADRMRGGGRLYVGAGTSGGIAALDASECVATFSTSPDTVIAVVAGGEGATPLLQAVAEDDRVAGANDLRALDVGPADAVVGVSASGATPYVLGGPRSRYPRRRAHRLRRVDPRLRARGIRRARDRGRRRVGVHRGLDAPQGGDCAEAGAQHDLDRIHDSAGKDVRKPDGRRRRCKREAARARPAHRPRCDGRVACGRRRRARRGGRKRPRCHRLAADRDDRRGARARLDESGQSIARAVESSS